MAADSTLRQPQAGSALRQFVMRLHFYLGLFVGPFIFAAALSGTLYVLTPQLEDWLYRDQLVAQSSGSARPLSDQIAAARAAIGEGPRLLAIRPAAQAGATTRVMFTEPGLGDSETRAIFIDPASLHVQGDLIVYGTSGVLPLRTTLDYLHRNLLLGDIGRNYSELAASWLWVAVLGGVLLWLWRRGLPNTLGKAARQRRLHGLIGIWISLGLLFLSATGLTWSRWAGNNIDEFRNRVGWVTPSVTVELGGNTPGQPLGEHAEHLGHAMAMPSAPSVAEADILAAIDPVVATARAAGIDSPMIEIRPPRNIGQAFRVSEYDRRWPSQVDTIAIDPKGMAVTNRADFKDFPIIAKLIRWGIDTHMGVLFGLANQIVMAGFGIALMVLIAYGYRMWWLRRPKAGGAPRTLLRAFSYLSVPVRIMIMVLALAFGIALPAMGVSLAVFLLMDLIRSAWAEMAAAEQRRSAPPSLR